MKSAKTPEPQFYNMNTAGVDSNTCSKSISFENLAESKTVTFCIRIHSTLFSWLELPVKYSNRDHYVNFNASRVLVCLESENVKHIIKV